MAKPVASSSVETELPHVQQQWETTSNNLKSGEQDEGERELEEQEEAEKDDELETFRPLMASMKLETLPSLVSKIRMMKDGNSAPIMCQTITPPMYGGYHLLRAVRFEDDLQWILKMPTAGCPNKFDDGDALALESEVQIMRTIRQETSIPVPEICHYDSSLSNEINCPYILMDFLDGIPLDEVWFDGRVTSETLEQRRRNNIVDVAHAMQQLDKFTYQKGGKLQYVQKSRSFNVGSTRRMTRSAAMTDFEEGGESDKMNAFIEVGPWEDPPSLFLAMLDLEDTLTETDSYYKGMLKLVRLWIQWAPLGPPNEFVLCRPDFDIQNFIVSEDGHLKGIIDWDDVTAVPRCVGNRALPGWLTRDWDPIMYGWGRKNEVGEDCKENSPDELARYREFYVQEMERAGATAAEKRTTINSLVLRNLLIAADNPFSTHEVIMKVFTEIQRIIAPRCLKESETTDDDGKDDEAPENGGDNDEGKTESECRTQEGADNGLNNDERTRGSKDTNQVGANDNAAREESKETSEGPEKEEADEDKVKSDADGSEVESVDPSKEFYLYEIVMALSHDSLDEKRMGMLREGFLRLFA